VTFAEAEVVGRIVLGRFAVGPVPVAAILQIDNVNRVAANNRAARLQPQIVHTAQTLFEYLRAHDRRTNREDDAAVKLFSRSAEQPEIDVCGAPDGRAFEHWMV